MENREPGAKCLGSPAALMWGTDVGHIQPSGSCQCLFSVTQSDISCLGCHLSARPPLSKGGGGRGWFEVSRGQWWHTAVLMTHTPQRPRLLSCIWREAEFHHLTDLIWCHNMINLECEQVGTIRLHKFTNLNFTFIVSPFDFVFHSAKTLL